MWSCYYLQRWWLWYNYWYSDTTNRIQIEFLNLNTTVNIRHDLYSRFNQLFLVVSIIFAQFWHVSVREFCYRIHLLSKNFNIVATKWLWNVKDVGSHRVRDAEVCQVEYTCTSLQLKSNIIVIDNSSWERIRRQYRLALQSIDFTISSDKMSWTMETVNTNSRRLQFISSHKATYTHHARLNRRHYMIISHWKRQWIWYGKNDVVLATSSTATHRFNLWGYHKGFWFKPGSISSFLLDVQSASSSLIVFLFYVNIVVLYYQ